MGKVMPMNIRVKPKAAVLASTNPISSCKTGVNKATYAIRKPTRIITGLRRITVLSRALAMNLSSSLTRRPLSEKFCDRSIGAL
jgi:hypothetical protein